MPAPLVVDASLTFRLLLPGDKQAQYRGLVGGWLRDGAELVAPTLWLYEMTSALCKTVNLGALLPAEGEQALALAQSLGVRLIVPENGLAERAFQWTLRLNRAAAYDSFYLALAESLSSELWTADRRLVRAVDRPWVRWAEESMGEG